MSTRHPCRNRPRRTLADRADACLAARTMTELLGTCPACGTSDQRIDQVDEHGTRTELDRIEPRARTTTHVRIAHERWCPAVDERAIAAIRRQRASGR